MKAKIFAWLLVLTLLIGTTACTAPAPAPSEAPAAPTESEAPADSEPSAEPEAPAEPTGEEVVVKFLHIWPEHAAVMDQSIAMIEEANPGLKVQTSVVPWNEVTKTVQTALQSGDMYDVFLQWGGQVAGYESIGLPLDLTPYFEADQEWKNSFLNEACLEQYSVGDKIYGIPFRGTGVFMIYNKTMFDEHGWTTPNTQEELEALMATIQAAGIQPIAAPGKPNGFQVSSIRSRLTDHIVLMAGRIDDPLRLNDRQTEWDGLIAQGAQKVKDWYQAGYLGENAFGIEREEAQTVFFTGKAAMLMCNNNELTDLRALNKDIGYELDSFLFPAPKDCPETLFVDAGFGDGFGVWSGTQVPDAAVAVLKGLNSTEVCALWGDQANSVMPTKDVPYSDPLLLKFAEQFEKAGTHRVVRDYNGGNLDDLHGALFVEFMTTDMTADDFETQWEDQTRRAIEDAEE